MTEEDLREIEDRLRASGNKPVRMVIATLSLDVEKLLAEVRRLHAATDITSLYLAWDVDKAVHPAARARWHEKVREALGDRDIWAKAPSIPSEPNAGGGNLDE